MASGTRRFDLTPTGRVTAVTGHGWSETYAYDSLGNITRAQVTAHTSPEEREFTGTLIRRAGRTLYEHDAQGRLIRRTRKLLNGQRLTWTFSWNAEDRLTSVTTPTDEVWHYTYDPLGRRISKYLLHDNGTTSERTDFAWDGTRLTERTTSAGVTTTWEYVPGTHRPLAQVEHHARSASSGTGEDANLKDISQAEYDMRFYAIVSDAVGTPTELVGSEGELAWCSATTLWGIPRPVPVGDGEVSCPLRFPGQYEDEETGLHYNCQRYYDPQSAHYLSADPLGLVPADHHHSYCRNPLAWIDPLGLADCVKAKRAAEKIIERAASGKMRKSSNYHPHFGDDRVLEILKNPDAVYVSEGGQAKLIFRQGEDIVVTKGKGAGVGDVITGYGPSGVKGESGAKALGGSPDDPGDPITHEDIVNGNIKTSGGDTLASATQIT
ncbi:RHS repeat domain-containing protein [Streptomyces thermolineatus]|uniref:RHS repeat domain-containing protein n=1 Tax=Streptomyces thermolineatus TaxID=44033 RepID=UPI00384F8A54